MQKLLLFFIILLSASCSQPKETASGKPQYLKMVGDSKYDPLLDRKDFVTCHGDTTYQYFQFGDGFTYKGEKKAIIDIFSKQYRAIRKPDQTGLIRIRFLVNCKGQTGRFRLTGIDANYNPKVFDRAITGQLLSITKGLKGWKVLPNKENPLDYYQYLIFKIEGGEIKEILP